MKTIIAGSRSITYDHIVYIAVELSPFGNKITEVVSGGAHGVDKLGELWAKDSNIPIKQFLPNWTKFGKGAGFARNLEMAMYADALIAIWDGYSKGTGHMIDSARARNLQIYLHLI